MYWGKQAISGEMFPAFVDFRSFSPVIAHCRSLYAICRSFLPISPSLAIFFANYRFCGKQATSGEMFPAFVDFRSFSPVPLTSCHFRQLSHIFAHCIPSITHSCQFRPLLPFFSPIIAYFYQFFQTFSHLSLIFVCFHPLFAYSHLFLSVFIHFGQFSFTFLNIVILLIIHLNINLKT